jgi:hypothetical protein
MEPATRSSTSRFFVRAKSTYGLRSDIGSPNSVSTQCRRGVDWGRVMQDPLSKANRYRQEAAKCYELAKSSSPSFLSDCYRRVAVQYLFMAEGELKLAEQQGHLVPEQGGAAAVERSGT